MPQQGKCEGDIVHLVLRRQKKQAAIIWQFINSFENFTVNIRCGENIFCYLFSYFNISTQKKQPNKLDCFFLFFQIRERCMRVGNKDWFNLQKGGDPAATSDTATLLRLSPN